MNRSTQEIKRLARANLMGNYRMMQQVLITCWLIPTILDTIFIYAQGTVDSLLSTALYYVIEFLILLIQNILFMGQCRVNLAVAMHEKTDNRQVFYCLTNNSDHFFQGVILRTSIGVAGTLPSIVAMELYYRTCNAPFAGRIPLVLGLMALSGVLTFLITLHLEPFYYLMMHFTDMPVLFAFKESLRLMQGNRLRLAKLYLSFIGLIFLSFLSLGIAGLWAIPYMNQSLAVFYLDVIDEVVEWTPPYENTETA